ncbi:WEB family protein At1g12150-like isoform X2 [Tasmannia lanceolata]
MGEIDTKPFESVQAALSLFGQKNDQRKYRSTSSEEMEKDKELDLMMKDLASYKVQLEIKESSNMQLLLKLEVYRKTIEELSTQVKKSEAEREKNIEEYGEAKIRIDELEFDNKKVSAQLFETRKAEEELRHSLNELKATQEQLKTVLDAAEESKLAALREAELMETAIEMEKERTQELLSHVSELNEAILHSKLGAIEAEKEKSAILMAKEEEIEIATVAATQAQEHLEEMRKQLDMVKDLENQLLEKSLFTECLQMETEQAKGAASDATADLDRLRRGIKQLEEENSEKTIYVESMEAEMKQLREVVDDLNHQIRDVTFEMEKLKIEMVQIVERESEAQVEIAVLKSELHSSRSKTASAEAAEARAKSVKSGLYIAVQQLAIEAEEAKKETQRLKQEALEVEEAKKETQSLKQEAMESDTKNNSYGGPETPTIMEWETEITDVDLVCSGFYKNITISVEEYESLTRKAKKADRVPDSMFDFRNECEVETLKKELEVKKEEIGELQSVVEQAVRRAEMAEKAKLAVEDHLRKWRQKEEKRRALLASLREESSRRESNTPAAFRDESISRESNPPVYNNKKLAGNLSLGKVLKLKF